MHTAVFAAVLAAAMAATLVAGGRPAGKGFAPSVRTNRSSKHVHDNFTVLPPSPLVGDNGESPGVLCTQNSDTYCKSAYPICCGTQVLAQAAMYCIPPGQQCCQNAGSLDGTQIACGIDEICCPSNDGLQAACCTQGESCIGGQCTADPCANTSSVAFCLESAPQCGWCCGSRSCVTVTQQTRCGSQSFGISQQLLTAGGQTCYDECSPHFRCDSCLNATDSHGKRCGWCCQSQSCFSTSPTPASRDNEVTTCDPAQAVTESVAQCGGCAVGGTGVGPSNNGDGEEDGTSIIKVTLIVGVVVAFTAAATIIGLRFHYRNHPGFEDTFPPAPPPPIRKYGFLAVSVPTTTTTTAAPGAAPSAAGAATANNGGTGLPGLFGRVFKRGGRADATGTTEPKREGGSSSSASTRPGAKPGPASPVPANAVCCHKCRAMISPPPQGDKPPEPPVRPPTPDPEEREKEGEGANGADLSTGNLNVPGAGTPKPSPRPKKGLSGGNSKGFFAALSASLGRRPDPAEAGGRAEGDAFGGAAAARAENGENGAGDSKPKKALLAEDSSPLALVRTSLAVVLPCYHSLCAQCIAEAFPLDKKKLKKKKEEAEKASASTTTTPPKKPVAPVPKRPLDVAATTAPDRLQQATSAEPPVTECPVCQAVVCDAFFPWRVITQ